MARKTFISYKYSEACDTRDRIVDALGDDASYYTGETSDSPNLDDLETSTIKEKLKDMIFGTSVTIVIASPNFKKSKWIDWEIEYSLKEMSRNGRVSKTNGVVCVVQKTMGNYQWLLGTTRYPDGHTSRSIDTSKLYDVINNNRSNRVVPEYTCEVCQTIDRLTGSYISLVEEDEFILDPSKYIENAYEKSRIIGEYVIKKTN